MTDEVPGGLDEPDRLQPEPGALALASTEDDWSRADWEKAAAAVLRKSGRLSGEDADDAVWAALTRTTYDGVAVPPLGTPDLLEGLVTAGRPSRSGPWDIRPFCGAGPERDVNGEVHADLLGGATSLWLGVGPQTDFAALLADVQLKLAPVVLRATGDQHAAARSFLSWVGSALHPDTNLGVDAARANPEVAHVADDAGVLGFIVDANKLHGRGADDSQELGWAIATGADYLRAMEAAGLQVDLAARLVEFRFAVTDVQFVSIAKLRAARRLWARVLELSGAEATPMRIHAVTSAAMTSRYDPWVNMLRGTVAAFAAGVGGADAVTVLPFDSRLGRPDAFGRRIARNVSSLLVAESHVAAVADPAGGAYAVEKLTDDLATAAWAELGRLESEGADAFTQRVAEVRDRRREDVAHRRMPITGLSEFPQLGETLPERPAWDEYGDVEPYGAEFESFRGDPLGARVFLATLGPVARHTARATFATNLLAAGGVPVDAAGPTSTVGDVTSAYGGQRVVCVAGTDATYAEWGSAAAEALREAGARRVLVVGRPADWADDACARGEDAVAFLRRTREALA